MMRAQAQYTVHTLNDVVTSSTAPASPYLGQLWVDTSKSPPVTKVWNGSAWKEQNGTDTIRTSIKTVETKAANLETNLNGLKSTVTTVTKKVETIESDLGEAQENILDVQTSVSELEQTASDIALKVTQNEENISSLTLSHNSITARVKTAEGNITTLKADVSGIKTRVSTAEGDISSLEQTASSLTTRITNSEGKVTTLTTDVNGLKTRVSAAEGDISAVEQSVSGITARIESAEGDITSLEAGVSGITTRVTNSEKNISSLQQTSTSLTARVNNAEGNITTLTQTVDTVSLQAEDNRGNIASLTTKYNTVSSTVSSLSGKVTTVEQTVSGINQKVEDNRSNISTLTQTVDEVAVDVSDNKGNIATLTTRYNSINSTVSSLSGKVTTVEQTVNGLTTRVGNAEGSISSLEQTTSSLSASVSGKADKTGGTTAAFGWSLTTTGFYLYSNGSTVMSVTNTGLNIKGSITATSGELSEMTVTGRLYFGANDDYFIDPNYDDESYYIYLPGFRVDDGQGAVFSGRLSAPSGTIGGFTITTSAIYKTKTAYSSSTAGVYIGTDGIGLGAGTFYVTSAGALTAKSGTIGGFSIGTSSIYKSKTSYSDTTVGVYLGTDGIGLGAGAFYVTSAGSLYCSTADITGKITATSGTVENLTINGKLTFGGNSSYYINANYNDSSWYIRLPGMTSDEASGTVFSGKLSAPSGTIGGFTISTNAIYKTKTSYSSSTSGVYIGTDGIGLGSGAFYVTSAGALNASNVNITGGSIKLGASTGNTYTKIDSVGIQCGGLDWARFKLMFNSLHLYANQWGDSSAINDIAIGWFGGGDTGISLYGINATLADEDFYVYATRKTDSYTSVGFYMRARSGITCKGHFVGTWTTSSSISVSSDARIKNSIEDLTDKYSILFDGLCPKRFKYNDGKSGRYHTGFIAQEVKESMDAAKVDSGEFAGLCIAQTDTGEEWSLRYEEFIAINTMEIKKLKAEVKALKDQIGGSL